MSIPDDCNTDCGDEAPDPEPGCGEDEGGGSSEGGGGGGGGGGDDTGCCTHWNCVYDGATYQYTVTWSEERSEADCIMPITEFSGDPSIPCNSTPLNMNNNYNTWSPEPCQEPICSGCGQSYFSNMSPGDPGYPNPAIVANTREGPWVMISDCNGAPSLPGYTCSNFIQEGVAAGYTFGAFSPAGVECACKAIEGGGARMSYHAASDGSWALTTPCSQEECEAHVSTWMAEASGKPNEEGLYKVKWILLDGCPGACCSDQPTQPEFVKSSTLIDAPCKCGCN